MEGELQVIHARMYAGGGCTQEHDTRSSKHGNHTHKSRNQQSTHVLEHA